MGGRMFKLHSAWLSGFDSKKRPATRQSEFTRFLPDPSYHVFRKNRQRARCSCEEVGVMAGGVYYGNARLRKIDWSNADRLKSSDIPISRNAIRSCRPESRWRIGYR